MFKSMTFKNIDLTLQYTVLLLKQNGLIPVNFDGSYCSGYLITSLVNARSRPQREKDAHSW
jgi:hypothetical protein